MTPCPVRRGFPATYDGGRSADTRPSRQFLIKLLERADILHHMVGTHRRIYFRDLLT